MCTSIFYTFHWLEIVWWPYLTEFMSGDISLQQKDFQGQFSIINGETQFLVEICLYYKSLS